MLTVFCRVRRSHSGGYSRQEGQMQKPRSFIPRFLVLILTLSCQGKRDLNYQAETQQLRDRHC